MKYILCEVETFFVKELDRSRSKVSTPLQIFDTKDAADEAYELFNPFYNFNLRVVSSEDLDSEFR